MRRDELRHLIRAACRVTGEQQVIVMGSQAILGSWKEIAAPDRVTVSNEADIAFFADPDELKADTIMGCSASIRSSFRIVAFVVVGHLGRAYVAAAVYIDSRWSCSTRSQRYGPLSERSFLGCCPGHSA